eukprot:6178614-Pleurochrysis_carterae.AAC.2
MARPSFLFVADLHPHRQALHALAAIMGATSPRVPHTEMLCMKRSMDWFSINVAVPCDRGHLSDRLTSEMYPPQCRLYKDARKLTPVQQMFFTCWMPKRSALPSSKAFHPPSRRMAAF